MEYLKNRWGSDRSVNVNVNVLKVSRGYHRLYNITRTLSLEIEGTFS